jgi:hypothetical protein
MKAKNATSRQRELEAIVDRYIRVLNGHGADSQREIAFRNRYAADPRVMRLLAGVRAVKALFEVYGDFPDVRPRRRNAGARREET